MVPAVGRLKEDGGFQASLSYIAKHYPKKPKPTKQPTPNNNKKNSPKTKTKDELHLKNLGVWIAFICKPS